MTTYRMTDRNMQKVTAYLARETAKAHAFALNPAASLARFFGVGMFLAVAYAVWTIASVFARF